MALFLVDEKIKPKVVKNMHSWEHSGFSVGQSVRLAAGDLAGIERLVQYMTHCPLEAGPVGESERIGRGACFSCCFLANS